MVNFPVRIPPYSGYAYVRKSRKSYDGYAYVNIIHIMIIRRYKILNK